MVTPEPERDYEVSVRFHAPYSYVREWIDRYFPPGVGVTIQSTERIKSEDCTVVD